MAQDKGSNFHEDHTWNLTHKNALNSFFFLLREFCGGKRRGGESKNLEIPGSVTSKTGSVFFPLFFLSWKGYNPRGKRGK